MEIWSRSTTGAAMAIQTMLRHTARTTLALALVLPHTATSFRVAGTEGRLQAQVPQMPTKRIAQLQSQINSEEAHHATQERLGELWLALADSYQDQFDSVPAEGAFAHALRLLRGTGASAQYADALDGMGTLYLRTGRLNDAEEFLKKSAEIYLSIPDTRKERGVRVRYAIALLRDRRFVDAELQSTNAAKNFESDEKIEPTEIISAYLTRSYAICAQRRYSEALKDVDRAMNVARTRLPANSIDTMAVWLARGVALWKSGDDVGADQAMQESLRIVRTRKDLPSSILTSAQLGVLGQYEVFLKATHRKKQAKEVALERTRVQETKVAECNGCTVNAAAFAQGVLLP
jgi:tetratricopeptide (TPR) repeat protein